MILRLLRFLMILILLAAVFGGVGYYIYKDGREKAIKEYNLSVTLGIETAVAGALFDATRTAESDIPHYRLITLGTNDYLVDIAARYNTTVDVLRIANGLASTVESGSNQQLVVPEGVQSLIPPRRFFPYFAVDGDTLKAIAARNNLPLDILEEDNPVLKQRGIIPGDIVFVAKLL